MESLIKQIRPLQFQSLLTPTNPLETLFDQLKGIGIDQLLQDPEAGWETRNRIREVVLNWRHFRVALPQQRYYQLLALQVAHKFLRKAIVAGSLRYTIYLLELAAHLQIAPEEISSYFALPRQQARRLVQRLASVLLIINVDLNAASDAPGHELRKLQKGREAIAQLQVKETYELLDAIDRGGRGVRISFPISALIRLLAALDYQQFVKVLQQQKGPFALAIYLRQLPISIRYRLGLDTHVSNPWALFELLHKLTATEKREEPSSIEQSSALTVLKRLHKLNAGFFQQAVVYFRASQLFNGALGYLLATWPVMDAVALLQTNLPINRYKDMQRMRSELLLVYAQQVETPQVLCFLEQVFVAWETFLEQFRQNRAMDLFDVLETDYWDYILNYYRLTYDSQALAKELAAVFAHIQWLNSEWHLSKTTFIKSFYLYYTKLYALSCAYQQQQNTILEVQYLADAIESDMVFITRNLRGIENFAELLANLRQ